MSGERDPCECNACTLGRMKGGGCLGFMLIEAIVEVANADASGMSFEEACAFWNQLRQQLAGEEKP